MSGEVFNLKSTRKVHEKQGKFSKSGDVQAMAEKDVSNQKQNSGSKEDEGVCLGGRSRRRSERRRDDACDAEAL